MVLAKSIGIVQARGGIHVSNIWSNGAAWHAWRDDLQDGVGGDGAELVAVAYYQKPTLWACTQLLLKLGMPEVMGQPPELKHKRQWDNHANYREALVRENMG
jgi:hypothetical protein